MSRLVEGIQVLRLGTTSRVAVTTASATSAVLNSDFVRVANTDGDNVHFAIGSAPTATTASALLPKGAVEYLRINSGVDKFAFLAASGSSTVTVTETS